MIDTDAYAEAVAYLCALDDEDFQDEVDHAWNDPATNFGGCLFDFTGWSPSPSGLNTSFHPATGARCGCLVQVRESHLDPRSYMRFGGAAGTLADLLADERIPRDPGQITKESLPAFAEWQRRLDAELDRHVPRWLAAYDEYVREST